MTSIYSTRFAENYNVYQIIMKRSLRIYINKLLLSKILPITIVFIYLSLIIIKIKFS